MIAVFFKQVRLELARKLDFLFEACSSDFLHKLVQALPLVVKFKLLAWTAASAYGASWKHVYEYAFSDGSFQFE